MSELFKKYRVTIILVIILSLLAAFYFLYISKQPTREEREKKGTTYSITKIAKNDVEEIILEYSLKTIVVRRIDNKNWQITQPIEAKADSKKVDEILDKTTDMDSEDRISLQGRSLAEFGLDHPQLEVTLKLKENKGYTAILFGDKTVDGTKIFVQKKRDKYAYLMIDILLSELEKSEEDLKEKKE